MAALAGSAALLSPLIPSLAPPVNGSYGTKLKRSMVTPKRVSMATWGKVRSSGSLVCSHRKPISAASLSYRGHFGTSPAVHRHSAIAADTGFSSSLFLAAAALPSKDYLNHQITYLTLPRHKSTRTVISRASNSLPYPFTYPSTDEEKPRWYWRTLACIPYLMPLHIVSVCAEGAHQFLPFLENFSIMTDPVSGALLPNWFMMVYCITVYFMVVRSKTWPHFFRFHVAMALLLDNAIQIINIVAGWMPYWSKLDTPFWTVVASGLLYVMVKCVMDALRGRHADIPFLSEAAFMHTYVR
ncbi:uncharacterized protein A4U43_C08F27690 [Asparagus officinalis]|uniref:protein TIC 20-I, chloroplastic-like n=1 Tax=Asparagus officinalis TaxID=4686 RepID=UPI00098E5E38|nr:protein TIC 20-I, chloroplastic-like [Asparagus officinalis]ONK61243.1 uncharacterized protein A4U43_C08F27690 [Asparagus officinalis]